jgi:predicted DNA-binding protein
MKHQTNYQLPLRLNDTLAEQLHEVSEITGIQKSKICRMGISRIVTDIYQMGALESIRTLNQYYQEIQ